MLDFSECHVFREEPLHPQQGSRQLSTENIGKEALSDRILPIGLKFSDASPSHQDTHCSSSFGHSFKYHTQV